MKFDSILYRLFSKVLHVILSLCGAVFPSRGKVLMIHSVGDDYHDYNLPISEFETLLRRLSTMNVVRLEEWNNHNGFVCLTFDDVPDSFYYNAYPLLLKYKLPFTVFISCSLLDTPHFLTTEMLKEIAMCDLCTVGSHGCKHDFYRLFDTKCAINELLLSKNRLEGIIKKDIELFAFPYGSFYACGLKHIRLVSNYYKFGFGTVKSPVTRPLFLPKFFLPRINVDEILTSKNN